MSMTTAAYLRISTRRQSIDQQHDAIAAAAGEGLGQSLALDPDNNRLHMSQIPHQK